MPKPLTRRDVENFLGSVCQSFGPYEDVMFDRVFWDRIRFNIQLLIAMKRAKVVAKKRRRK